MEKENRYDVFLEEVKKIDRIPPGIGILDARISKLSDLVEKLYPDKMFKCDNSGKGCAHEISKPGLNPSAYKVDLWQLIYSTTVHGMDKCICPICEMKMIDEVSWLEGIGSGIYKESSYEDCKKMATLMIKELEDPRVF